MSILKGKKAEEIAGKLLSQQQLKILEKNYTCRSGEIDLIMLDEDELVFVEVKARKKNQHGYAAEFVDKNKQKRLITTAKKYLTEKPEHSNRMCRFDVFEINNFGAKDNDYNWIKDAFTLEHFSNI
jgi:putative endonuclease